ncbi:MAG: hypothetical protein ACTHLO_15125 [Pseudolabrys sp.]
MRHIGPLAASLLLILPAAAHARGSGSHHTSHSDITITKPTDKGSTKMMSRDAASGQATGKRMYKPYKATTSSSLLRGGNHNDGKGGRYLAAAKKLPGKRKPPTLTLKRGKTNSE